MELPVKPFTTRRPVRASRSFTSSGAASKKRRAARAVEGGGIVNSRTTLLALVDRIAHGLADEVRADREAAQVALGQHVPLPRAVAVLLERRAHVEVVAPARELEAVVAHLGRLARERRERQVGPLAGEEADRTRRLRRAENGYKPGRGQRGPGGSLRSVSTIWWTIRSTMRPSRAEACYSHHQGA